jgi:hypothetical protein
VIIRQQPRLPFRVDAVEKGFSVPERRRIFHERLPVENIDLGILHFGFYYCPLWMVHRSLIDFFNSTGQSRHFRRALGTSALPPIPDISLHRTGF